MSLSTGESNDLIGHTDPSLNGDLIVPNNTVKICVRLMGWRSQWQYGGGGIGEGGGRL